MTKTQKIVYYVLLVLLSVTFLFAAYSKLTNDPQQIAGFTAAGLPLWFMHMIGIGEIVGVILLWTRRFFRYGYEGLGLVLLGAIGTTWAFIGVGMALTVLVPIAMLIIIVWLHYKKPSAMTTPQA